MKKIIGSILVVFILIQFIRPTKNESMDYTNDISNIVETPMEVKEILKTACNDCHSNKTVYPWYSNIAPVSWYLALHVTKGKEHVNFSQWMLYNKYQKKHILTNLNEVLENHQMPLSSYLILHKNATLSANQTSTLKNWVKTIKTN